jgi:hypothetical protein
MSEKIEKKEEVTEDHNEALKKISADTEHHKKQDSRMMTFFNQEFVERRIDFKPKYNFLK